jgi:cytochrome c oxidase subunit 1
LQFADINKWVSIGGFAFGLSQLIFLVLIIKACRKIGEPVSDQVWEGAEGLEWEIPSPAPYHTFATPPFIK